MPIIFTRSKIVRQGSFFSFSTAAYFPWAELSVGPFRGTPMSNPDILSLPLEASTPVSPEALGCPIAYNARLRAEAPVYRCPHTGIVFVSDYDTITRVARDFETFSNRFGQAMRKDSDIDPRLREANKDAYPAVDTMLTQDPPLHRRYRGMVNQAFTNRRVAALESHIEDVCHQLIDRFSANGTCEFVESFSKRLPMTVIAEQLGVPLEDYDLFKTWSDAFVAQLSRMATPEEEIAAARLIVEFQKYFAERIEERRRNPREDIISDIVHARFEQERPLEMAEMLSILQQLLVAGNETTTHAISEGVLLLIRHPDQFQKLKADPELIPDMVEEVLRLSTPTANMWRVATRDTEIGNVQVPAGTMIQIRFASANRDELKFSDPDSFEITRASDTPHIAFGHGVHMCIGATLARKELEVAFRVVVQRFGQIELTCPEEELRYPPNVLLRGLESLPIRFTLASSG
jgi:cytochrome P450